MLKKEKPMMSVTAIIQGAQAQHGWNRGRVTDVFAKGFLAPLVCSEGESNTLYLASLCSFSEIDMVAHR